LLERRESRATQAASKNEAWEDFTSLPDYDMGESFVPKHHSTLGCMIATIETWQTTSS
jgi:hypothetical protein